MAFTEAFEKKVPAPCIALEIGGVNQPVGIKKQIIIFV